MHWTDNFQKKKWKWPTAILKRSTSHSKHLKNIMYLRIHLVKEEKVLYHGDFKTLQAEIKEDTR